MTHRPRMLIHTSRQAIRWGDMDSLGHVNNTVYFRCLEQARIEWVYGLQAEGEPYDRTGPVIVNASCIFLEPLHALERAQTADPKSTGPRAPGASGSSGKAR